MSEVALVTGASAGIGEEFARQLSARGYEVVLVARREDRLRSLAEELPGKSHVIASDLASEASGLVDRVAALGVEVDLLVNNAGFGTWGRFVELDAQRDAEQVRLNCEAIVTLCHAFLPGMVERRHGGVINVASTAGMQPLPYESVYSATKAFARTFSEALHQELRGTGVRVLAVNPGPVPTEWQAIAGYAEDAGTHGVPGKIEADQVVAESLRAYDRGRRTLIPGRVVRWFVSSGRPVPNWVKLRTLERMYRPPR